MMVFGKGEINFFKKAVVLQLLVGVQIAAFVSLASPISVYSRTDTLTPSGRILTQPGFQEPGGGKEGQGGPSTSENSPPDAVSVTTADESGVQGSQGLSTGGTFGQLAADTSIGYAGQVAAAIANGRAPAAPTAAQGVSLAGAAITFGLSLAGVTLGISLAIGLAVAAIAVAVSLFSGSKGAAPDPDTSAPTADPSGTAGVPGVTGDPSTGTGVGTPGVSGTGTGAPGSGQGDESSAPSDPSDGGGVPGTGGSGTPGDSSDATDGSEGGVGTPDGGAAAPD